MKLAIILALILLMGLFIIGSFEMYDQYERYKWVEDNNCPMTDEVWMPDGYWYSIYECEAGRISIKQY